MTCLGSFLEQQHAILKRFLAILNVIMSYVLFLHWWLFDLGWLWSACCQEHRVPVEAKRVFSKKINVLSYAITFHRVLDPQALRLDARNTIKLLKSTKNMKIGWIITWIRWTRGGVVYLCSATNEVKRVHWSLVWELRVPEAFWSSKKRSKSVSWQFWSSSWESSCFVSYRALIFV